MNNEPVAELVLEQMAVGDASSLRVNWLMDGYPPVGTKLYTHPAQTLTDEEIQQVWNKVLAEPPHDGTADRIGNFARAILRKAQEK